MFTTFRIMLTDGSIVTTFEGPTDLDGAASCAEEAGYDVVDVSEPDVVVVTATI
jgi:hypothetical protein